MHRQSSVLVRYERLLLPVWRVHRLGRWLQFVGLLILPFAIASELVEKVGLGQSVLLAAAEPWCSMLVFKIQHRS